MAQNIPERKDVAENNTWDLSKLFKSEEDWSTGLENLEAMIPELASFKGTLGQSPARLKAALDLFIQKADLLEERLGYYAMLRREENVGDSASSARMGRFMTISSRKAAETSFFAPELQSLPEPTIKEFLNSNELSEYRIFLEKLFRFKDHILSEAEETLLARQQEFAQTSRKAFSALTDVDMDFGSVQTDEGEQPLTNTTFGIFLLDQNREVRQQAYKQFYGEFAKHKHTLSELYIGSIQKDVFHSRVRKHSGSRAMALFPDKVDESVYDNLVETVHEHLPALHQYYVLRKEKLGLDELRHFDTKVSLVKDMESSYSYEQACSIIGEALAPLGEEYVRVLLGGLQGRWVDRYENKGKRSGAFSAGSYIGDPYILMNYKDNDIRHIFTLAHEGGHSMHSHYSVKSNPFQHYSYTIFEAEVASTFNEQLLAHHLRKTCKSPQEKAYLIGRQIDDIIGTIYRQTMFAEYESILHKKADAGEPLTLDLLRMEYKKLLEQYFGPSMILEEESDLEGLRIPHFYRAFYVYKYATGLAAAIALSRRVLEGGDKERNDYLSFLKSGGSRYPLESLKLAGVDMSRPEPVHSALEQFKLLLAEFKTLV